MRTALTLALMTALYAPQVLAEPPPASASSPSAVLLPEPAPLPAAGENVAAPAAPARAAPSAAPAPANVVLSPAPGGYVPQARQEPQRIAPNDERIQIEQRLAELQAEQRQYGIGGPIAMMGVGFGGAFVFASGALIYYIVTYENARDYYDEYGRDADYRTDGQVRAGRTLFAISVLSLGLGLTGSVLLGKRLHARNVFKPEIRSLKLRQRELDRDLRYSATVNPEGGVGLSVRGRF